MKTICRIPQGWQEYADQLDAPYVDKPWYDLTKLPDPPDKTQFWSTRKRDVYNALRVPMINALERHYLWGIKAYVYAGKPTKSEKIDALWKCFYYMSEDHLPKSWEEVLDIDRDAGPRLLKWKELVPAPTPISKFYPRLPPQSFRLDGDEDWFVPADAPPDMPRTYMLQFQLSSSLPEKLPWSSISGENSNSEDERQPKKPAPKKTAPKNPALKKAAPSEPTEFSSPSSASPPSNTSTRSPSRRSDSDQNPSGQDPSGLGGYEEGSGPILSQGEFSSSGGGSGRSPYVIPANYDAVPIREIFEKAIMNYTYRWLDRHPGAPYKGPIPHRIAEKAEDLAIVQSGAFRSVQAAKINMTLQLDADGFMVPVRGRGPIWEGTSCAIDCVIVLGNLLDAGCTIADRGDSDGVHFTDLENAFVEVTNMNWEAFSEETSKELRNAFYRILCNNVPSVTMDNLCHSWVPWSECTKNFAQFRFDYTTITKACHCRGVGTTETAGNGRVLDPASLPADREGVTLNMLWSRAFPMYHPFYCSDCGSGPENDGPWLYRKITNLPLRLVVQTEPGTKIWQHTRDQIFDYLNADGESCQVAYRWLGGIYGAGIHGRVFWGESKRFEAPTKDYAMYDGALASGMIVSLPASDDEENIPLEWVHDPYCPPILVFERIMNPETPAICAAINTLNSVGQMVEGDQLFKYVHIPWTPDPGPPLFNYKERQLPAFGGCFLDSKRPDPFETLPDDIWDIKIPDWLSLAKIDPNRDLVPKYGLTAVDSASQVPVDLLGTPPSRVPEDVSPFDSPHVGPQSLAARLELWPPGSLDITGALDFPDLSSRSDSRSGSSSSQGGGRPYTLREYFNSLRVNNQSPRGGQGAQTQGGDSTASQETPSITEEEVQELFQQFTHVAGSHSGSPPPPPLYSLYPRKRKRAMREMVLIENAKNGAKTTKGAKVTNSGKKGKYKKDATSKKHRVETLDEGRLKRKAKTVRFE
ncbi:hypothetical protein N7526_007376 [Penicillium atrosanguineum]|nr:hypothetical protein N7526_007376 [Penicillium atrosanguineum]